mgnify:CR=1 FL=1
MLKHKKYYINLLLENTDNYTAHRQQARWQRGYLGKKLRVVLPACAVNYIRKSFPDNSGNYTGYHPR